MQLCLPRYYGCCIPALRWKKEQFGSRSLGYLIYFIFALVSPPSRSIPFVVASFSLDASTPEKSISEFYSESVSLQTERGKSTRRRRSSSLTEWERRRRGRRRRTAKGENKHRSCKVGLGGIFFFFTRISRHLCTHTRADKYARCMLMQYIYTHGYAFVRICMLGHKNK